MVICGRSSAHMLGSLCNHVVAAPRTLHTPSAALSSPLHSRYRRLRSATARIIDAQGVCEFNCSLISFGFPVFTQPPHVAGPAPPVILSSSSLLSSLSFFSSVFNCTDPRRASRDKWRFVNREINRLPSNSGIQMLRHTLESIARLNASLHFVILHVTRQGGYVYAATVIGQ